MTTSPTDTTAPVADKFADRWRFLTEDAATSAPRGGYVQIIRDHWWVVCPYRGLTFFWSRGVKGLGSPQCNSNEAISRRLGTTIPGAIIKQIPLVFVPINLSDYAE